MKVYICRECKRLQNEQQFLYRHGIGVRKYLVCKMCRYPEGGEVVCKTQVCPDCSLPSPRSNFCVYFRGQAPTLRENCTECRCNAHDPDTLHVIDSENRHHEMSAVLKAEIDSWDKEYNPEPQPPLLERIRLWLIRLIKRQ